MTLNWSSVATHSNASVTPSLTDTAGSLSPTSALQSTDKGYYSINDFAQRGVVAFLLSLTAIVGIAGNLLVLAAVLLCRRLQTRTNVYVVNLAVADLLTCIMLPFQAATVLIDESTKMFLFSNGFCALVTMLMITCLGCSILTMATIAISRYLVVTKPKSTCKRLFPPSVIALVIVASWLIPALEFGMAVLAGHIELGYYPRYRVCAWHENFPVSKFLIAPTLFIALLVTIGCYWKTYLFVRRHARSVANHESTDMRLNKSAILLRRQADDNNPVNPTLNLEMDRNHARRARVAAVTRDALTRDELTGHENSVRTLYLESSPPTNKAHDDDNDHRLDAKHCAQVSAFPAINSSRDIANTQTQTGNTNRTVQQARSRALEAQITKNLFLVVCACVVCIVPFVVCFAISSCQEPFIYTTIILFMGSAVNPMIYGFKHPHFRPVFASMIMCRLANIAQPSNLLRRLINR